MVMGQYKYLLWDSTFIGQQWLWGSRQEIHSVSRELWAAVAQQLLHEEDTQDSAQVFALFYVHCPGLGSETI